MSLLEQVDGYRSDLNPEEEGDGLLPETMTYEDEQPPKKSSFLKEEYCGMSRRRCRKNLSDRPRFLGTSYAKGGSDAPFRVWRLRW